MKENMSVSKTVAQEAGLLSPAMLLSPGAAKAESPQGKRLLHYKVSNPLPSSGPVSC